MTPAENIKTWAHHVHDNAGKVAHMTTRMIHERSFWGMVLILALIAGMFAMVILLGDNTVFMDYRTVPMP
jgi:hypothetical protein